MKTSGRGLFSKQKKPFFSMQKSKILLQKGNAVHRSKVFV